MKSHGQISGTLVIPLVFRKSFHIVGKPEGGGGGGGAEAQTGNYYVTQLLSLW